MPDNEKEKKAKDAPDLDIGVGGFIGGLFEGVSKLVESAGKAAREGGEFSQTGEIGGLGDKARGVYGFTVRTMAGGETKVETFGNIKKTEEGPVVEEVREPIVDVFNEEDHLLVVAELPGIEENRLKLMLEQDLLTLSAENRQRKYEKEVVLPCAVDASSEELTFRNGVLEVKYSKSK